MYTQLEAELRARAAEYGAALLVERPELCRDELQSLTDALDAATKDSPRWECQCLISSLDDLLQRDDEDTDETARLIFRVLSL